jgi:glycosyltransferase involved in cell wall biosynthesis
MPGDGTKLGTIPNNQAPPARLLDLTRLISRAGRVLTGIDRVELAYLVHLLQEPVALFGLVRTTFGYALLDADGLSALQTRILGTQDWGPVGALSRLARGKPHTVKRAESDVRKLAVGRCRPRSLGKMLTTHLPQAIAYLNLGHTNLNDRVLWAIQQELRGRVMVFVHDTIPLDFPHYQRPQSVERFRAFLRRAGAKADLLVFNSASAMSDANRYFSDWAMTPHCVVAHLGIAPVTPAALPEKTDPKPPYFVTIGTIEPRKNHAFLLDIWDQLPDPKQQLFICGQRGWQNKNVFDRLDTLPPDSPIIELPDLGDGALATLVGGSAGLLFPSFAEGYGLPPIEAAALGVPVVCNDLPVFRETIGDIPVYAAVSDRYSWITTINKLAKGPSVATKTKSIQTFTAPNWADHFNIVLRLT